VALNYPSTVLLTRLWGLILAILATGCLAGMFLLSSTGGGGFSESDESALVAVTEAGVAALEAEIRASKVQAASGLLDDESLQEALSRSASEEEKLPDDAIGRDQIFAEVAEDLRLRTDANITLAVVDQAGQVRIANGIAPHLLGELVANDAYREAPTDDESIFSVLLGGDLNVAYVSPVDPRGHRLVAIDPLQIGGGSLLRRVLGSKNPAGLLRGNELVGDVIGEATSTELELLARSHRDDAPDSGSSRVFVVGEGLSARLGALGRVPGPAGKGKSGVMLGVLSRKTAATGQRDLAQALRAAASESNQLNWPLLLGLLAVSAALAIYLPQLEALAPMRRLSTEFENVARGTQHQIFHDRYAGPPGEVARAAANAHEALRRAYLAELEIDGDADDETATAPRPRPRTGRQRKLTRSHQKLESRSKSKMHRAVPDASESAPPAPPSPPEPEPALESRPTPQAAAAAAPRPTPPPPAARPTPAPPVAKPAQKPSETPGLSAATLAAAPRSGHLPNMPPPGLTAPLPTTDDSKEGHYREVFEEFLQVKEACGEPTNGFSFEKFAAKLRKNRKDLLEKRPGLADVNFTVYVKDGKAALKAKVVKS
jgi:hypothetical protein